jgi:hypothetical protein
MPKISVQLNSRSLTYAQGYVEGDLARMSGKAYTTYVMVGIDEYCLGFRAGYFANDRCLPNTIASDNKNNVAGREMTSHAQAA